MAAMIKVLRKWFYKKERLTQREYLITNLSFHCVK